MLVSLTCRFATVITRFSATSEAFQTWKQENYIYLIYATGSNLTKLTELRAHADTSMVNTVKVVYDASAPFLLQLIVSEFVATLVALRQSAGLQIPQWQVEIPTEEPAIWWRLSVEKCRVTELLVAHQKIPRWSKSILSPPPGRVFVGLARKTAKLDFDLIKVCLLLTQGVPSLSGYPARS